MTGKLFIVENGNLESSNVSINDIQAKLDENIDYVSRNYIFSVIIHFVFHF